MPTALIITAAGINCDVELARGFELAGANAEFRHLNELLDDPSLIDRSDLIGLPGGFSYGDSIAAGRIMAQLMRQHLYGALVRAIKRGVPMIAPCNGFQIAAQIGLLPGPDADESWPEQPPVPTVALAQNESACFIDRWVRIEVPENTRCIWTRGLTFNEDTALLPIAHGEGRFVPGDGALLEALQRHGRIAVRYAEGDNPNGSTGRVAGICDRSGLVFGLMPHPERYTNWLLHPWRTRLGDGQMRGDPPGLQMFRNAVAHARQGVAV